MRVFDYHLNKYAAEIAVASKIYNENRVDCGHGRV